MVLRAYLRFLVFSVKNMQKADLAESPQSTSCRGGEASLLYFLTGGDFLCHAAERHV